MTAEASLRVKIQYFASRYITSPGPHKFFYRLTGGLIGSRLPGVNPRVLLLTVTGRKSGKLRTSPMVYWRDGERLVVVGSNNGKDQHPSWYWNLKTNPRATVQTGRDKLPVTAEEAAGEERERLWKKVTENHPLFAEYQRRTSRQLPVFILTPAGDGEAGDV